jgi:hypothetical protein
MLTAAIKHIDRTLRLRHGIVEYASSPCCIFRMELAVSEANVVLTDGTILRDTDRIILLHLWNEHIPPFPPGGPTLGWARRLSHALEYSLRELESYLGSRPELDDIVALRAEMALAAKERNDQLIALSARYGFEPVEAVPAPSMSRRIHRFGENILIAMLVLAHNPASFRIATLRRSCTSIFLSRATLRRRFAPEARQ